MCTHTQQSQLVSSPPLISMSVMYTMNTSYLANPGPSYQITHVIDEITVMFKRNLPDMYIYIIGVTFFLAGENHLRFIAFVKIIGQDK